MPPWESTAFERVNTLPQLIWPAVWAPMQLGSLAGSIGVVAATHVRRRDRRLTAAALVASQAGWWAAKLVKKKVSRGRPAALLADVQVRENATGLGYASGHAAVAFSLATALAPSVPRSVRPALFATATTVGLCRLYAGAHLPLDIVGGAGIGILCGTGARWCLGLGGQGLPAFTSSRSRSR